jgi:hypothetical protein
MDASECRHHRVVPDCAGGYNGGGAGERRNGNGDTTRRDLNGRDAVSERVVTLHARTNDEERVVIETYVPLEYADRLALNRRVRRVTSATSYGTQTVEETEEHNPVAPSEPPRMVRRSVTTVRRSGSDSYVSERQVFERDANGQLVLVRKHSEQTSRN